MSLQKSFLAEVEVYLDRTKAKPSTFGMAAVGDPNFVFDLRREGSGREPRLGTVDRVRQFIRKNPKGLPEQAKAATPAEGAAA